MNQDPYTCPFCPSSSPSRGELLPDVVSFILHVREKFKDDLKILRGYVCPLHSQMSGGRPDRHHSAGESVDFEISHPDRLSVAKFVDSEAQKINASLISHIVDGKTTFHLNADKKNFRGIKFGNKFFGSWVS